VDEPLVIALGITVVGMTLLFLTLLFFYGLLSLMTVVFKAPAPVGGEATGGSEDSPAEGPPGVGARPAIWGREAALRAAAIAVALARAEAEQADFSPGAPKEGAAASPWWSLHHQRRLTRCTATRRSR